MAHVRVAFTHQATPTNTFGGNQTPMTMNAVFNVVVVVP